MPVIEQDLTKGPLLRQIFRFSVPLMLSNLLQMLFSLADAAVVGQYAGSMALGAVGSTSMLVALFTAFFLGMGNGTNLVTARFLGAKQNEDVRQTVHSSLILCAAVGFSLLLIGITLTPMMLSVIRTRDELMADAQRYLRIYCLGMPAVALYNYGRAVFSAMGETRKPFYYLLAAGILNLALNVLFTVRFRWGVTGVAVATVLAQWLSAVLIVAALFRHRGVCGLKIGEVRPHQKKMHQVFSLGLVAGLSESAFAIANLFLQTAINSFDAVTVAGHSAALNADTMTFTIMNAFFAACSSFMGQNLGAGNRKRFRATWLVTVIITSLIGLVCGLALFFFGQHFLAFFTHDAPVIEAGMTRVRMMGLFYVLCTVQDVSMAACRSMDRKWIPLLISFLNICVFRIVWILTVFAHFHTLFSLYLLYLFSFILNGIFQTWYFFHCSRAYWRLHPPVE